MAEAIRRMRKALGMTQARFGQVFSLTPRQVWELEAGAANPTLATLARLGKSFGFQPGFVLLSRSPEERGTRGRDREKTPAQDGISIDRQR